jgi:hypothetical protein
LRRCRTSVSAAIELIERLPTAERPELLAIYPSWRGDFPLWFGERVAEVPARGNVICGAPSKVIYEAHWAPLDESAEPFFLAETEQVTAEFDWADMVSERAASYERVPRSPGRVAMKLRPHGRHPERDVFDAGRNSSQGTRERFLLRGVEPHRPLRLVFRSAPVADLEIPLSVDGRPVPPLHLPRTDGWLESSIDVPAPASGTIAVELGPSRERLMFHAWAVQDR